MVNRAIGSAGAAVLHRYTEDALDLYDVLAHCAPGAKVKLDDVSKILGSPESQRVSTAGVWRRWCSPVRSRR